ncbi:MAG TPA: xanthine dehydrogenase family protein molybdopterin-binding subunit [Casimicrobiaceae bacterium]|nr:xanthine dehydrogenase family protein molybdopterin-binding subunit [Casimicrobiaceae bacterium]
MTDRPIVNLSRSRRAFLMAGGAAGAGLLLGLVLPASAQTGAPGKAAAAGAAPPFEPNAFVRIGTDDTVTVVAKHVEMGQGAFTGLATIVAEELDAAWRQVRVVGAPADATRYNNLAWGPMQGTGGSSAIANSWEQLRNAGASARAMLVAAAAKKWGVPAGEIRVSGGVVSHPSGRKASFGDLATDAGAMPVPTSVALKDPKDFVFVGKAFPRVDSLAKSNGTAQFTQDVQLPGMLTALVLHPPRFGARVRSFDASAVRDVPGVRGVLELPTGIAVVATGFWAAKQGRDALKVVWNENRAWKGSTGELMAEYRKLAEKPGKVARAEGDAQAAIASAATKLEASFEFPYLAHAAMEPMNCVMRLSDGRCEVWNGEQFQTADQKAIAQVVGLKPEQVSITMLYAGGSFGRRANPQSDYVLECAEIVARLAKAGTKDVPVKLVWTREDDMRGGMYRPMYLHALRGGIDAGGAIVGWQHRIVGQSILEDTIFEGAMRKTGIDPTSVEGAANLPYAIPAIAVDLHSTSEAVTVQWWRSVGSSHTAFSTETFLDELATAAKQDPVELRRRLLGKHPRHLAALDLAAKQAGWGTPLAPGKAGEKRGRGVAVHESFGTVVAQVVEATVKADGGIVVDRVVCAVECGLAVNPDIVRAQMEGGIGYGLSAALHGAITVRDGLVEQSNFHDYPVLRIHEMPAVEVHIVPSAGKPTGVGEPGTPVIAPALANALFAATGKRLRSLPLRLG